MGLDIRWPIGIIFSIYGVVLILYGAFANPAIFESSMRINIDVWWGVAMLAFGVIMGALAYRAMRRSRI